MSEQDLFESNSEEDEVRGAEESNVKQVHPVNSRRRFGQAGFASASVLMTLSSRPVWGARCLSNILSGNLSDPHRSSGNCRVGYSPEEWRDSPGLWPYGINYGTCEGSGTAACVSCEEYTGGTTFRQAFGSGYVKPMRELLCKAPKSYPGFLIAAGLNALAVPQYSMSVQDVLDIYDGTMMADMETSDIKAVLKETWSV